MVIITVNNTLLEDIYFCRVKRREPSKTGQVNDFITGFLNDLKGISKVIEIFRLYLAE